MATIKTCLFKGESIDVMVALQYREKGIAKKGDFTCVECGEALRAHKPGGHVSAHFEHFERNQQCPLSSLPNRRQTDKKAYESYAPDADEAHEGYVLDRKLLAKKRNRGLAEACKQRDNYTCQACNFKMMVNGYYVIEAHHTIPFSDGERVVKLNELVSLCPRCHRIAHLRKPPYIVEDIIKILSSKP
ncbi:hypothetical protein CGI33_20715 [Vibrio parahaemolyticus]|uniref:HNH endonuclease n=1 Tax=Vibrio TaxID=662 RepID=UPI001121DAE0|nr:HNH endonuclease [Vibrio parahaemolyticus]TOJ74300.1 hypothetical protein CGI33_20715 [Vibrio parahaemolyticus]